MEDTIKKPAHRAKKVQKFVVGQWVLLEDTGVTAFIPTEIQPTNDITDLNKMVAWAKANLEGTAGTYHFVRKVQGALVIAIQEELKFTFE